MRFVKTFVLHTYMDTELPGQICGNLQVLPKRKTSPFKNDSELLFLIQQLANEEPEDLPLRYTQDKNNPNLE